MFFRFVRCDPQSSNSLLTTQPAESPTDPYTAAVISQPASNLSLTDNRACEGLRIKKLKP